MHGMTMGIMSTCIALLCAGVAYGAAPSIADAPIDTSLLQEGIRHWQNRFGRDRNDARYKPAQYREIANNMLALQGEDGGWPKNIDWSIIDQEEMLRALGNPKFRSTFDNRSTYSQIRYLAEAYVRTEDRAFREGVERGLQYVLREQRPSGGWRGSDVDAITFNDDVMPGVMGLLFDVQNRVRPFEWVEEHQRKELAKALTKAIDVTLRCQIVREGVKTAWCQQHDHATLAPVAARAYELPSITAAESSSVVRFLMRLDPETPGVSEAIEAAVAWLHSAAIEGIRIERVPIEPVRFEHHLATQEVVVIEDPNTPPIWARYYEIDTMRPFFCNRDGVKVYTLEEVHIERRTGYAWYGRWPAALLEKEYPAWKTATD